MECLYFYSQFVLVNAFAFSNLEEISFSVLDSSYINRFFLITYMKFDLAFITWVLVVLVLSSLYLFNSL